MSTFVINGGAGADLWHIEVAPGQVFIAGQGTFNDPLITDVQVNGFGGDDLLVVNRASIPVVFNGSSGADWLSLTSGLMSGTITSTITFNDGAGDDLTELRDEIWPDPALYVIQPSSIGGTEIILGTGGLVRMGQSERLILNTGPGGGMVVMNAAMPANATTVNGGNGPDTLSVNLQSTARNVRFNGNGGEDQLNIDDTGPTPNTSGEFYALSGGLGTDQWTGYGTGGPIVRFDDATETLNFHGFESLGRNYNIFSSGPTAFKIIGGHANDNFYFWPSATHGAIGGPVHVNGGAGNDSFLWPATNNVAALIAIDVQPVLLDGGAGYNSLSIDDTTRGATSYDIYPDRIRAKDVLVSEWADFNYDNMSAIGISGSVSNNTVRVFGVSSDIDVGNQFTIAMNGGNDNAIVYPRNAAGELTIDGNLGISGGTGADTLRIDDTTSTDPINYTFSNPFGSGTQNVYGLGLGGFGTAGVESWEINAGGGDDTFAINQFSSGIGLTINAGLGDDACNVGNGDVAVNITSIASLLFNGQEGIDTFNLRNANPANSFTYTAASNTTLQTSRSFPGPYFLTIECWNTEQKAVYAGPAADIMNITSFASGELSFHGAGGDDALNLPSSSDLLGRRVNFYGGAGTANRINQVTNSKTAPSTLHVAQNTIGAFPVDDFFAPGGSVFFESIQIINLRMGSGADTAYMQPDAVATISIIGGNPTTAPGDTLNLALASAADYVVNGSPASGNVTSSNLKLLSYTGFETGPQIDDVAPAVIHADINIDGVGASGDGANARQSVDVQFSEDVSALIGPASLVLENLTTGTTVPIQNITVGFNTATNIAHFTFPGYGDGVLPDGTYTGRVVAGLPDSFGNCLPEDVNFDFFFLQGDANRDARVNLADFNILATNFGQSDRTFTQGDFNYDGMVNLADFNILASRFGVALGPAAMASIVGDGEWSRGITRELRDLLE